MNILIITPYLPYPLNSGGAQGVYNMIDNLRFKHNFTLVINEGGQNNKLNKQELQAKWPEVEIIYYPFILQLTSPRFIYEKARRIAQRILIPNSRHFLIESTLRPYGEWFSNRHINFVNNIIKQKAIDIIQVEFMECLQWINFLPESVKKVFVHHELGFVRKQRLLAKTALYSKEKNMLEKTKETEISALMKYDAIITVTDVDRKILQKEGITQPIYTSNLAINTRSHPFCMNKKQLTFIGGYGHLPNKEGIDWFIGKIAPILNKYGFIVNLIGTNWPASYSTNKTINLRLHGFVKELSDVALGSIMIVPILSGSGMRMKILEAAAMSLPIVTTTVGVEGLPFKDGESCLIADTPEDFANAIILLENDINLRKKISENANRLYTEKYTPRALAETRNNIYSQIIGCH